MNPYDYKPAADLPRYRVPFLASNAWHRIVTSLCLLACIALTASGLRRLADPTQMEAREARPMDYAAGAGATALGLMGCVYLLRQFRTRPTPRAPKGEKA